MGEQKNKIEHISCIKSNDLLFEVINLHFTDFCNFCCHHCFIKKEKHELSFEQLKLIVDKISDYWEKYNIKGRINIAGGEPLLSKNIDKLIDYIYQKGIIISIITNGYYLDEEFINKHRNKIDMIGISVDSLKHDTNLLIGRSFNGESLSDEKLINLANIIKSVGIKLKINICVSKLNVNEDFNDFLNIVKPDRCKILQMVCENDESSKKNEITINEFIEFDTNIKYKHITETKNDIIDSYLIIDSFGNISTNNYHESKISIFDYELEKIISKIQIDPKKYKKRYS